MKITIRHKGDLKRTYNFLTDVSRFDVSAILDRYGREGVKALAAATPVDTGKTAASWSYTVTKNNNSATLAFWNSNVVNGVPIAIILQYGHGTRNGGYVSGIDYINPALQPIFKKIAEDAWREVTSK